MPEEITDERFDALLKDRTRTQLEAQRASWLTRRRLLSSISFFYIVGVFYGLMFFDFSFSMAIRSIWFWIGPVLGAAGAAFLLRFYFVWFLGFLIKKNTSEVFARKTEALQENLEKDFFTNLVKINFKYIDQYYLQTQIQASRSFTLSATVSVAAFLVIIAGIFVLLRGGAVTASTIATISGILAEFVAAVFFYLYNRTVIKMAEYHQKLVLTQNVSLALKIAEDLPEKDKVLAKKELIQELSQDVNQLLTRNFSEDRTAASTRFHPGRKNGEHPDE